MSRLPIEKKPHFTGQSRCVNSLSLFPISPRVDVLPPLKLPLETEMVHSPFLTKRFLKSLALVVSLAYGATAFADGIAESNELILCRDCFGPLPEGPSGPFFELGFDSPLVASKEDLGLEDILVEEDNILIEKAQSLCAKDYNDQRHVAELILLEEHAASEPFIVRHCLSRRDIDYFRLRLRKNRRVAIETKGSIDTLGVLEDTEGRIVWIDDDGGDGSNFRIVASLKSGDYYLRVEPYDFSAVGIYRLVIRVVPDPI